MEKLERLQQQDDAQLEGVGADQGKAWENVMETFTQLMSKGYLQVRADQRRCMGCSGLPCARLLVGCLCASRGGWAAASGPLTRTRCTLLPTPLGSQSKRYGTTCW